MQNPFDLPSEIASVEIPDLAVIKDIGTALERCDDALLWAAARRSESQSVFYERLRDQVGGMEYNSTLKGDRLRRRNYYASLLAIPVVLNGADGTLIGNAEATAEALGHTRKWLQDWFGSAAEIMLLGNLFGYSEICAWSPSELRLRLNFLVNQGRGSQKLTASQPIEFGLPPDAPILAFIIGSINRPVAWPELPPLDPQADMAFQARVSGSLQLCGAGSRWNPVKVLVPDFATQAIENGLTEWFEALAATHPITRWDVNQADLDRVIVHLQLGEVSTHTVSVPLRAHHLGLAGLEKVLAKVAGLASAGSLELTTRQ